MCSDCWGSRSTERKNFRRGGVDVSDFDHKTPYRHPPRRKKVVRSKEINKQCKEHLWDVVPADMPYRYGPMPHVEFYNLFGFYVSVADMCLFCGKTVNIRYTEEFAKRQARYEQKNFVLPESGKMRRGGPVQRFGRRKTPQIPPFWYQEDEKFIAFEQKASLGRIRRRIRERSQWALVKKEKDSLPSEDVQILLDRWS